MREHLIRLRSAVLLLAAFAICSHSTLALAQINGSGAPFNHETFDGGGNLETSSSYSEARNASYLVRCWRGLDGKVAFSVNGSGTLVFGNTQTVYGPTIVQWQGNQFIAMHTGIDQRIYWTTFNADTQTITGGWQPILNLHALGSPGAASVPNFGSGGSFFLYVAYAGTDSHVYGADYDTINMTWHDLSRITAGGRNDQIVFSSPGVGYNLNSNVLYLVVRADNQEVFGTWQFFGATAWQPWIDMNLSTITAPQVTRASGGILVSAIDQFQRPNYRLFDEEMLPSTVNWVPDGTGWTTDHPVNLITFGNTVYALFTGQDQPQSLAYWKAVLDF